MPNIIAVIQARLGSTRLPGKILLPILGQPMLARIVERLRFSQRINGILLSTTDSPQDDALVSAAAGMGIASSRGPVDNIVERLHRAAIATEADILVRVWGDCPCVDPAVIDAAIGLMLQEGDDYVSNSMAGKSSSGDGFLRTFPYGLDIQVFRRTLLDRLALVTDPFYQEFPEDYLRDHADDIRIGELRHHSDDSDIYVTVDYAQDMEVVRCIYERLYRPDTAFGFGEIVTLLRRHPELDTRDASLARNIEYVARKQERTAS